MSAAFSVEITDLMPNPFQSQTVWHINELSGSNQNDGKTAATSIANYAELVRRVGLKWRLVNQRVDIYFHSNVSNIQLSYSLGPGGLVVHHGTRNITSTGTVTAFAAETFTAEATLITDTSRSTWTAGELLRVTSGTSAGAWCWVAKDKGSGVARVSRPSAVNLNTDFFNTSAVTLSVGDAYETETLSTVSTMTADLEGTPQSSQTTGQVVFIDCDFPQLLMSSPQPIVFIGCKFHFYEMPGASGVTNSCWTGILLSTGVGGSEAGLFLNVVFDVSYGAQWFYNSHPVFQGTAPRAKPASLLFFEDYGAFFDTPNPLTVWYGSRIYVRHGVYGTGITGDAIQVQAGGQFRYSGTTFSLSGQTNDVTLGGKAAIPRIDPDTNISDGTPLTLSFANLQASFASGGFGGSAVDLYSLAAFLEVPDASF